MYVASMGSTARRLDEHPRRPHEDSMSADLAPDPDADAPLVAARLSEALTRLSAGGPRPAGGVIKVPSEQVLLQPEDRALLPFYPFERELGTARVPDTPLLADDASDRAMFLVLVNWWMSLCRYRYGAKCREAYAFIAELRLIRARRERELLESPRYQRTLAAAMAMREHAVSPPAWINFCFEYWKEAAPEEKIAPEPKGPPKRKRGRASKPNSKRPHTKFVFSAERITRLRGWYRQSVPAGGLRIPGPQELELQQRYAAMENALRKIRKEDRARQAAEVVATYFPDNTFTAMVTTAHAENARVQRILDEMVLEYTWVWGAEIWKNGVAALINPLRV